MLTDLLEIRYIYKKGFLFSNFDFVQKLCNWKIGKLHFLPFFNISKMNLNRVKFKKYDTLPLTYVEVEIPWFTIGGRGTKHVFFSVFIP